MNHRTATTLLLSALGALLGGCASTRTIDLHIETVEGTPMGGALVTALPLGISSSPLPLSAENLRQAGSNTGTGGVTDLEGNVRLTIESSYDYEIRVQPPPSGELASRGIAWSWVFNHENSALDTPLGTAPRPSRPTLRLK